MMEVDPRFFDYAAGAPIHPDAMAAWQAAAREFSGNPSAVHSAGAAARDRWESLGREFMATLSLPDGFLVATSGGTEANNLVIGGTLARHPTGRILIAADSHASSWSAAQAAGSRRDVLPLGADGLISPTVLEQALKPETVLVSLLHAQHETGVVQPVAELAAVCARRGVPLHLDGVQAVGKLPVDFARLNCRYYTFSAHKFGGPRGFGGVMAASVDFAPQMVGGDQQAGRRAGTENLPGLAGSLAALKAAIRIQASERQRLRALAVAGVSKIRAGCSHVLCNSDLTNGLPGLVSLSFPGQSGSAMAADLDLQGFAIGTASACHARRPQPSRSLLARGLTPQIALGSVRVSMGSGTTPEAVADLAAGLLAAVRRQRQETQR